VAARSIPGQRLRSEYSLLERAVLTANLATADELKTWKPGGENNPDKGVDGALRYLCRLHRFHARGENRETVNSRALQDTQVLQALRDQPVLVTLPSAVLEKVFVYPKSMDALMLVHGLDIQLTWMNAQRTALLAMETPEAIDALPRVLDAISYTYQLLVWIVTSEGPAAPFAAQDEHPEPPAWITKLEPWDFIVICQAHQQHLMRLSALAALLDDKKSPKDPVGRPSWSVFYGSLALDTGEGVDHLMKHRSLVSLMASVRLSNYAKTPVEKDDAKT
jgi:hypothetical protein